MIASNSATHSFYYSLLQQSFYTDFWTMITAVITFIGLLLAWLQLRKIDNTNKADFLYRFNSDFFYSNKIMHKLSMTIEKGGPLLEERKGEFDIYDIYDYLGYLELMKTYLDQKVMTLEDIDILFGFYIVKAWRNKEIKQLIEHLRNESKDDRYFQGFQDLALELIKLEDEHKTQ